VSTLLHVFVDIEMTGQAVAFEMKFSYRRPMYEIMKYLWEMEDYKKRFVHKAQGSLTERGRLNTVDLLVDFYIKISFSFLQNKLP